MKRVRFGIMMALALTAAPAIAQQAQPPAPQAAFQPATSVSMANVRLELEITDQTAPNAAPIKKVVSMLLAERGNGRVRSQGTAYPSPASQTAPPYTVSLNADAHISRIEGDRIRVDVTVEYSPVGSEGSGEVRRGSPLSQTVTVVLANGKPTIIVQAADPLTDRKVTLEATATILR